MKHIIRAIEVLSRYYTIYDPLGENSLNEKVQIRINDKYFLSTEGQLPGYAGIIGYLTPYKDTVQTPYPAQLLIYLGQYRFEDNLPMYHYSTECDMFSIRYWNSLQQIEPNVVFLGNNQNSLNGKALYIGTEEEMFQQSLIHTFNDDSVRLLRECYDAVSGAFIECKYTETIKMVGPIRFLLE